MDLVGIAEVAEIAGVSRQAVVNWRARFPDFPVPTAELASGPVWLREDIDKWLKMREGKMEGTAAQITASGKMDTQDMGLRDFDRLDIGSAIRVEVVRSDAFTVKVTADDNLLSRVDIGKSGSTLRIRMKPWFGFHITSAHVAIGMPDLRGIKVSGAVHASVSGFESDKPLDVSASGASTLRMENMKAGETDISVSGASHIDGNFEMADGRIEISGASALELKGSGNNVKLAVSGASSARLADFKVAGADVKLSGASKASVNLNGKLDADLSGSSRLTYDGEASLGKMQVTGASTLKRG